MELLKERATGTVAADRYRWPDRGFNGANRVREAVGFAGEVHGSEDGAIERDRIDRLKRCFRSQSLRDQELLALKFEVGLPYRQIAQAMQMSEMDVRLSICTTLIRLQEGIRGRYGGQGWPRSDPEIVRGSSDGDSKLSPYGRTITPVRRS